MPAAWGVGLLALGLGGAAVAVIYANIAREIKRILAWSSVENIGLAFGMFGFQVVLRRAEAGRASPTRSWPRCSCTCSRTRCSSRACSSGPARSCTRRTPAKIEMLGGLAARMPRLSAGALALCLAAAALPPFGSFVAELMLVQSALAALATHDAAAVVAGVAVLIGVAFVAGLAVFAMVRLFAFVFLAEPRSDRRARRGRAAGGAPPAGAGAGGRRAGARPPVAVAGVPLPGSRSTC